MICVPEPNTGIYCMFLMMRAGMIMVYLMDGLVGLVEVAVEAVAGVIVIGAAQAPRGAAMM